MRSTRVVIGAEAAGDLAKEGIWHVISVHTMRSTKIVETEEVSVTTSGAGGHGMESTQTKTKGVVVAPVEQLVFVMGMDEAQPAPIAPVSDAEKVVRVYVGRMMRTQSHRAAISDERLYNIAERMSVTHATIKATEIAKLADELRILRGAKVDPPQEPGDEP